MEAKYGIGELRVGIKMNTNKMLPEMISDTSRGKIKTYFTEIAFNPHIRGKLTRFSSVHDLENFGIFEEHFYVLENVQTTSNCY